MIFFKLIVIICYVNSFCESQTNYCEICVNHTLCKYKMLGPSPRCEYYDNSALLTSQDITQIVKRINQRRNFVAMGYSKNLPQAANMKKIHWSTELATFAQRWVDQCEPSIYPDKEDQCRELENLKVGQNIATVIGPSPGLNVKSFIEMWFIKLLDYTGSVTYYNKSQDFKTDYFTQLIWADTEFVGCGKAKFYVVERDLIFERLVCNFAPKGNNHGKPVYSIGYPGTQCKSKMIPDRIHRGLCVYEDHKIPTKITTQKHPANRLLRILNLSNDSLKHDIDPIRNNLKHINVSSNINGQQRNQKTRHIFPNKTYGAAAHITPFRDKNVWKSIWNISRKSDDDYLYNPYQQERGHSHLYHGHETTRYKYEITTEMNTLQEFKGYEMNTHQEFRKYDFATNPMNSYTNNNNYRRNNQNTQCTRQISPDCCTRMSNNNCCQHMTTCPYETPWTFPVIEHCWSYSPPNTLCPSCMSTRKTCPPVSTCNYDTNCQCTAPCCTTKPCCFSAICPEINRKDNELNGSKNNDPFQDYMIPNIIVRSGNNKIPLENSPKKEILSFSDNSNLDKSYKPIYDGTELGHSHHSASDHSDYKLHNHDYLYHSFDSSLRKKREIADKTTKPFWQNENIPDNSKRYQLRSIRYTTLPNKRNRKLKKNSELAKWSMSTEPITLNMADYGENEKHITEKYLSFDELMHLGKISDGYIEHDFRRKNKKNNTTTKAAPKKDETTTKATATTTKATQTTTKATQTTTKATTTIASTTEYTANTPFERKKHCTRKLTCTWTAFTADENGDLKIKDQLIEIGSRTPPGYVEGCTRTSTCTRDFMDRNKFSTIADSSEGSDGSDGDDRPKEPIGGDEDYCERRSLNVQRRNSDEKKTTVRFFSYLDYTDAPTPFKNTKDDIFNLYEYITETPYVSETGDSHDCICNQKYVRQKRQRKEFRRYNEHKINYSILNKILSSNQVNKKFNKLCPCNCSFTQRATPKMFLFILAFLIY